MRALNFNLLKLGGTRAQWTHRCCLSLYAELMLLFLRFIPRLSFVLEYGEFELEGHSRGWVLSCNVDKRRKCVAEPAEIYFWFLGNTRGVMGSKVRRGCRVLWEYKNILQVF